VKRAFLVLGPESSGSRFVTELLVNAGCEGSADHHQPFDNDPPRDQELVVWRRSYPHGEDWPDAFELIEDLRVRGYSVAAVVCMRDFYAMCASQVRVEHAPNTTQALTGVRHAYRSIFADITLCAVPYWIVSYESLVARPTRAAQAFVRMLGLDIEPERIPEVKDGNAKYY